MYRNTCSYSCSSTLLTLPDKSSNFETSCTNVGRACGSHTQQFFINLKLKKKLMIGNPSLHIFRSHGIRTNIWLLQSQSSVQMVKHFKVLHTRVRGCSNAEHLPACHPICPLEIRMEGRKVKSTSAYASKYFYIM